MKLQYQYIHFVLIEEKPKTKVWECINNRSEGKLGILKWNPSWRQYCYFPTVRAVYSKGCLDDISNFIRQISKITTGNNQSDRCPDFWHEQEIGLRDYKCPTCGK